jgi:hypothetical protein
MLVEIEGVLEEIPDLSLLACRSPWARGLERSLRAEIYQFERLQDDHVIEPWFSLNWQVESCAFGQEDALGIRIPSVDGGLAWISQEPLSGASDRA